MSLLYDGDDVRVRFGFSRAEEVLMLAAVKWALGDCLPSPDRASVDLRSVTIIMHLMN